MARQTETTFRLLPIRRKSMPPSPGADWRCTTCNSLLGRIRDHEVHIRFSRRHEYIAALPVSCTCVNCGGLNRLKAASPH